MWSSARARLRREPRGLGRLARSLTVGVLAVAVSGVVMAVPAAAATVIDGCVIVAHPNAVHHTRCPGADLSSADLSGLDLNHADLSGADLSSADLAGSSLRASDLSDADLGACQAIEEPLSLTCNHATVTGADFTFAHLTGSSLLGVDLSSDHLEGADLSSARLISCVPPIVYAPECVSASFQGSHLREADLSDAITTNCFFLDEARVDAFCGGVGLAGADLSRADLGGTDLSFADLAGADLRGASFAGTTFSSCPPADIIFDVCSRVDLSGADLRSTSLAGLDLQGVQLRGADLTGADLTGSDLSPLVLLEGIVELPTTLDHADLTRADLTRADLTAASTTGTHFIHATWSSTTCPDGTNSDGDGQTCLHDLATAASPAPATSTAATRGAPSSG